MFFKLFVIAILALLDRFQDVLAAHFGTLGALKWGPKFSKQICKN